jgi:hypothetical protein
VFGGKLCTAAIEGRANTFVDMVTLFVTLTSFLGKFAISTSTRVDLVFGEFWNQESGIAKYLGYSHYWSLTIGAVSG